MKRHEVLTMAAGSAFALTLGSQGDAADDDFTPIPWNRKQNLTVAFVVGKQATVIDFAGPWEVFQDASLRVGPGKNDFVGFDTAMVSDTKSTLEATNGMLISPAYTYDTFPKQPNVIVMGAQGEHTPAKIAWIKEASKGADVVMSVCTGAFLLAQTGLLDGLRATTHHDYYDAFEKRFPAVHLIRGPRFVDNGKISAAGGLTSGIELALHIVGRYMGTPAVKQTAYYMEYNLSPQRPTSTA